MNLEKLNNNDLYNKLQEKKKKIVLYVLIIGLFMIGVNTYAWFTMQNTANVSTNAKIKSFIVKFNDSDLGKEIGTENYYFVMKPGMTDWKKNIEIVNQGDTDADVTVGIESLTLFGNTVTFTSLSDLQNNYPFKISLGTGTATVASGTTVTDKITFSWDYEYNSAVDTKEYFPIPSYFTYSSAYQYYDSSYNLVEVDDSTFDGLKNDLYLYRDDLDTYLSDMCTAYISSTGESYCVQMNIVLKAVQSAS